jgi:salicylate hydroxylase
VVHYPLQGGKVMNFVATREVADWQAPTWRLDGSAEECAAQYQGWHPDVLALIERVPSFVKWALLARPFLPHWSRGRATLLGDACHPTLPSFAQGANMALEDGVVLARCLEGHRDVEKALGSYERLRMDRTYRMVRAATDFMPYFNHPSLADPAESEAFISRVWRPDAVTERYDWLFGYDPEAVTV